MSEGYNVAGFEEGGGWPQDKKCKCLEKLKKAKETFSPTGSRKECGTTNIEFSSVKSVSDRILTQRNIKDNKFVLC